MLPLRPRRALRHVKTAAGALATMRHRPCPLPETPMDESLAPPAASQRSLWLRFLYMVLMAIAFYVAAWVLGVVAIVQLLVAAFGAGPLPKLRTFGAGVGSYLGQLARFLSFESEDVPFPFADWPTAGS
jgi:hypothetical protein